MERLQAVNDPVLLLEELTAELGQVSPEEDLEALARLLNRRTAAIAALQVAIAANTIDQAAALPRIQAVLSAGNHLWARLRVSRARIMADLVVENGRHALARTWTRPTTQSEGLVG
jgi:hypothetical protein